MNADNEEKIKYWTLDIPGEGKQEEQAKETEKEQTMRLEENQESMRYPGSQVNK